VQRFGQQQAHEIRQAGVIVGRGVAVQQRAVVGLTILGPRHDDDRRQAQAEKLVVQQHPPDPAVAVDERMNDLEFAGEPGDLVEEMPAVVRLTDLVR